MTIELTQAHRDFPATERWTYMDVSARGLMPRFARDALVAHLDERMYAELDKYGYFDMIERVRGRLAQHLHASPDEIAFTKNVTEGIAAIAASIDWRSGDNLVVCPEIEHPANVYAWLNLQRRGVEMRMVAPRAGLLPVDETIARIDARTRVVTCATVSFAPGFRTDLAALGAACRERGVLLVVDAAQSVGVLDNDVEKLNIDALAASTQKGLLGLYGMGFLYCRREIADRLQPAYLSRFGVDLGDASEADLGSFEYRLAGGARRFDLGNYNFTAAVNVDTTLEYLAGFGQEAIERYVLGLSHRLARGLLALGLPVSGGEPGTHLAHIVTVGEMGQGGHDSTGDARMQSLHDHLAQNRVKLSIRRGVLRFSLHLYNTERDVDRVLDLATEWSRRGAGGRGMDVRYVDAADGSTYPVERPLWRSPGGSHLNLTPGAGLRRGDIDAGCRSLWRYAAAIRVERAHAVSMGEGWTPLIEARWDGIPIRAKLEFMMPTGSFKDRGMTVMISYLERRGVAQVLEDSSGNAGASLAAYAAAAGIRARILVPETASYPKIVQMAATGADVVTIPGTRQDVADAALVMSNEIFYASHNWQAFFAEGTKTLAYELWEQLGFRAPDNVVVPLGYGANVLGCDHGFRELLANGEIDRLPRVFGVQAANCAPYFNAFAAGEERLVPTEVRPTVAEGIASSKPTRVREVLRAVRASGGSIVAVSEEAIGAALAKLARQGLYVEPTSAAAAAGLSQLVASGAIAPRETTVLVLTGSGLKAGERIGELLGLAARRMPA